MSFRAWLIQIGKSASTADKYSRAVTGVISTWAKNAGLMKCKALMNISRAQERLHC